MEYQEAAKLKEEICASRNRVCGGHKTKPCELLYVNEYSRCAFSTDPKEAERRLIAYRDSKRLKLSETGLKLLKALLPDQRYWIAADKDGDLCVYYEKPKRYEYEECWNTEGLDCLDITAFKHHFPIKWEDEPKKISEWIKESEV